MMFDFSVPSSVATWNPINDAIMGGVSQSQLQFDPVGHAVFSGTVSFENNGGFASVRCQPSNLGVIGATSIALTVCGDGKRYKLNLRTDNQMDGINYQARFEPPGGQWTTLQFAMADFLPTWRGRLVPEAPVLDLARLRQVGLMIADRQPGPFALAVCSIAIETL
jgi:NADH dehydrogenase [ubiquinone] 1 alpha subcomplex assembly factor 1